MSPKELCPTPEKVCYPTKAAALAARRNHQARVLYHVYRCRCKSYHLSSHPRPRRGGPRL
jgi:hypothetical protein